MLVSVSAGTIRVDGIQFGTSYKSHAIAINEGKRIHALYYPTAKFVVYEPSNK